MGDDKDLPRYQVYALRYATREGRRQDNFIGGDPHDGPMPMDYFCWLAVGDGAPVRHRLRIHRRKCRPSASAPICAIPWTR